MTELIAFINEHIILVYFILGFYGILTLFSLYFIVRIFNRILNNRKEFDTRFKEVNKILDLYNDKLK